MYSALAPRSRPWEHGFSRVRRRKTFLLPRLAFMSVMLMVASYASNIFSSAGEATRAATRVPSADPGVKRWSRRLLGATSHHHRHDEPPRANDTEDKNCTEPAIHEFPTDIFTNDERKHGGLLLHVFCTMYMFYALALVCDDFFVPSLEKISERLQLSEDVAGATFMAAGSSAPELFTSVIGVFVTKGDVGVGTIVGSAVFNILCIIGVCGLFAGQIVRLTWWSLFRDSVFYTISIIALILFICDEIVSWWESVILVMLYAVYILVMKFNMKIQTFLGSKRKPCAVAMANGTTHGVDVDDSNSYDPTMVLLSKGSSAPCSSVIMVDEILCSQPHKLSFSEAGLRMMITSHFGPRTRLRMASRMLILERQRVLQGNEPNGTEADAAVKVPSKNGLENGGGVLLLEKGEPGEAQQEEKEDDADGNDDVEVFSPISPPDGVCNKLKWMFAWPLGLLLYFTVPNCAKARWENWFMASFVISTIWIAVFSYVMVWMVTVIGYTLGIPDVIMGITFLAAGTSVPDCMASLIVARQGMGDMAVSNSIGSNVFDILVGLGLPWALQTLLVDYGSHVEINSRGLIYSVVLLLASVGITVLGIYLNNWKLDRKLGLACLFVYAVFLCFSIMIEFNVFTFVNLPMCRKD
ncbi:sodium/potassium/calcium exchanger 3 [Lampetra fluviatilis]